MDLSFIILNYHSEQYLDKCISSIKKNITGFKYEIIIVNNNSKPIDFASENSVLKILNTFSNIGFSKGCNLGAKAASGKILFFLNPDAELLDNKLEEFLPMLDKENVGIIAPSLVTEKGNFQPWSGGRKITPLKTILKNLFLKKESFFSRKAPVIELDWISGAALLIKKELFEKIKGFDENFFMYFEDVDLCQRVRKLGKKVLLLSQPAVLHYGGKSAENNQAQKELYYKSQDYYFEKHFGKIQSSLTRNIRRAALFFKNLLTGKFENNFFFFLLAFCIFLPFQFALNPIATIDLAIVRIFIPVLFLIFCFQGLKNKKRLLLKSKLNYFIFVFLFLAIFSIFFSQNLGWSIRKLAFLFSIFPFYFILPNFLNEEGKRRKLLSALVLGGALVSIFALIQFGCQFFFGIERAYLFLGKSMMPFFIGNTFSKEVLAYPSWLVNSGGITYMRAFAPFPDPHMLSYYVGMLLPWSIALWATSKAHKLFFLISSTMLAICDIATFTRGGYLAIIVAAIVILPLVSRKTAWKIICGIFLFIFLFFAVPKNPVTSPVAGRMISTFDINEGSNRGRIAIWKQALSIIAAHPQGVGIGAYPLMVDSNATYRTPIYIHNTYLDIAAELGVIAAMIFIIIILTSLNNFLAASKKDSFYLAGIVSLLIFAIHSLVENPLYSVHILPLFLIVLAISFSLQKQR
jgi:GT2 family glycosyltransferase